jgi:Collagen triple helix repeat (20 copies)
MTRGFLRFLRRNTVAMLALFLALGGTTYAASTALIGTNTVASPQVVNGSLQTKDLSKKARTALKGNRGLRGPAGAAGAAGAKGATGAQGVQGIQGIQGIPGPFPSTLPAGKTLVGTYSISQGAVGGTDQGSDWGASPISFDYPLAAAPTVVVVTGVNPDPTHCTGTTAAPAAASGFLCVYQGANGTLAAGSPDVCPPAGCGGSSAASKYGGVVRAFGSSATTRWYTWGTWAVTGN